VLESRYSCTASGARCEGSNPSGGTRDTGIPCTPFGLRKRWFEGLPIAPTVGLPMPLPAGDRCREESRGPRKGSWPGPVRGHVDKHQASEATGLPRTMALSRHSGGPLPPREKHRSPATREMPGALPHSGSLGLCRQLGLPDGVEGPELRWCGAVGQRYLRIGEPVQGGQHEGEDRAIEVRVDLCGTGQEGVLAEPAGQDVDVGEVACGGPCRTKPGACYR
jgi:hypothetical protein